MERRNAMATQTNDPNVVTVGKTSLVAEPGKQEVIITRLFDAPREKLFRAYTDPTLIPKYWANTIVDKMEVRPGGIWRYLSHDAKGNEYACFGVFHQIKSPERLVYTFESEGSGHVMLQTITLEDRNGMCMLTQQSVYQSVEDRDGILKYGMEQGAKAGFNRLAELLKTL
jgi:uncharacterized protein YndB with AHSA1/START domain